MHYQRMPIEVESPEEMGYSTIQYNLAESSVRDIYFKALNIDLSEQLLCYGEHRGDTHLRKAILQHETTLNEQHVLVCPSAATALFIISTTLLDKNDHLIVVRPNYATNIETPRALQCEMDIIDLSFDTQYRLDAERIFQQVKPNTKLISLTTPHNPTGMVFDEKTMHSIIDFAKERNIMVLVDETYRFLNFQSELKSYYAAYSNNVISVCSLSKAHGVPGIRTGWLICKNEKMMLDFLAAKEQIIISNSVVDEAIALHILQQNETYLQPIHQHVLQNFLFLKSWMNAQYYLEWNEPQAGVVCFPKIKNAAQYNLPLFYEILYKKYHTIVGPGHWFEQSDEYFRLGFAYPTPTELERGLKNILLALQESVLP